MKCRHCGYTIEHGVVCPLCGKKNIGPEHCAVCDTIIYPGQEYCSHCGTPGTHRKMPTLDISKGAFDLNKQSQVDHSYTFQEGYNYKENAYDYKEKVKQRIPKVWQGNTKNVNIEPRKIIIASIVIAIFAVTILFSALTDQNEQNETNRNIGNAPISTLHVSGDTNVLAKQANAWQTAYSFMNGNRLYLAGDFIWETNREFSEATLTEEYVGGPIYVKGQDWYFVDYGNALCRYNRETEKSEILVERIEQSYMVENRIYYVNYNHDLYYYDIDTDERSDVIVKKVKKFIVDEKQENIYYLSLQEHFARFDITNNQVKEYEKIRGESFIIDENVLYIYDGADKILGYDLQSEALLEKVNCGSIRYFAYYNNVFVCLDYTGAVYKITKDGEAVQISNSDLFINGFQIQGDRIFMRTLQEESVWYVSDFDGNFAIVSEKME